jgi:predicted ribosome quality control (RQC) complex YloA/Tae2 family protein
MHAFVEEAAVGTRLCVLKTRVPGETRWIVIGKGRGAEGVGVLSHEAKKARFAGKMPKGHARIAAASASLEGGALTRLGVRSATVVKGDDTFTVQLRGANVSVKKNEPPGDDELTLEEAAKRGDALLDAIVEGAVDAFRADVDRALAKAQARVARRVEAIEKDLAAMARAEYMLLSAQWLLPEAQRAKRGQKELVATDWSADPPREIKVALDPARTAKEQIEAMFKRARRLKAGRAFAEPRLASTLAIARELASLRDAARTAPELAALEDVAAKAKSAAPKDFSLATASEGARRDEAPHETGYRVYRGAGGARIFVGRTAKENDALTFKVARPHDVWLHAKGRRGAHVVVPRDRGEDVPADLLVDAAHLAAHFSEARDEAVVDVEYTHRKFLRKPKGGAPGLAIVEREKVIAVRIEKARLAGLLGEGE